MDVVINSIPCHLQGLTKVCFSPDGSTIFTGGSDCLVRIHKADYPDSEPGFHDNHTDAITSLTCSRDHLITSSLDNIARVFTYPENEFEGFITRSSGVPIRWVSVDLQGERVVVCSDDLLVKIVHVRDTTRTVLLSDNAKAVRSASWDPAGKYLVTAGCDAKLKIYDTASSTPVCVRTMEGVILPTESDSETSCYVAWHPAGNYFAVPTKTNDIGIISKEGWSKQTTFSDGHTSVVTELSWSPNGKYLASAADRQILVWSTETRQVVARYTHEAVICGLAFSPAANLIAFTSIDGSYNRWSDPVPAELPSPILSEAALAKKVDRLLDDDLFGDDDLEDVGENIDDVDDWIVDDDGVFDDDDEGKWTKGRTEVVNVTKAQEAFVPGSTEWRNKKRYLAFNMVGVVDVTDQETHHVVNVEFHDRSARRGYHFQDHNKYTMAALGEQGIVYAAPAGDQPSVIYYRPYDSWASQEWQVSLLPGEDVLLVAAGGEKETMGSVVVATSRGYLRFFSSTGIQRYMWRLGEDVVSMAAGRDAVLVVHREGGTSLDGCQNLRYSLMNFEYDLLQEGRVPLPKKTTLRWIGFTAQGAPAMYDSTGLLSVLDRYRRPGQARWVPLLDTMTLARREGKQEAYWPVGVGEKFNCIILKGSESEPWFPRPLIQEIDVAIPLLNLDNQQGKLEESVARGQLNLESKESHVAIDKELLQLVQGACKADNLARALDLTRLMRIPASLDAALKIAAFYHLPGLQERIQRERDERGGRSERPRVERYEIPDRDVTYRRAQALPRAEVAEFAPRAARRSFGGRTETPVRAETPVTVRESFIPETPGGDEYGLSREVGDGGGDDSMGDGDDDTESSTPVEFALPPPPPLLHSVAPAKRRSDDSGSGGGPKNPFAKKSPASNPFAKPATAKPLDSVKSTSFFDRVDDIESGKPKSKQTKLSLKPKHSRDEILEETQVQETLE